MKDFKVTIFKNEFLDQIVKLINESDHTDRSFDTWKKNSMTAVLAFKNKELIGAIPFEQHKIRLSKNNYLRGLWVSGAYVKPEYRGLGIGSLMDSEIRSLILNKEIVMVMRHDEGTAAFRWYIKNGYNIISEILSLKMNIKPKINDDKKNYEIIQKNDIPKHSKNLLRIFNRHNDNKFNYPERSINSWQNRIEFHYYKNFYKFFIILSKLENGEKIFAILGETSIKDNIFRIDILEISCPENEADLTSFFEKIQHFAKERKVDQIRIQVAKYDKLKNIALKYGFKLRWKTNLMSKSLNDKNNVSKIDTRFFQIDYV